MCEVRQTAVAITGESLPGVTGCRDGATETMHELALVMNAAGPVKSKNWIPTQTKSSHTMAEPPPIYNSRILKLYVQCVNERYPKVDVDRLLRDSDITRYELEDPGHWFNQRQVDRFFDRVVEATGNPGIAREAGRFVVRNETSGPVKQIALGLLQVSSIYLLLARLYPIFSRAANVETRKLAANKIEIMVTPNPDVHESPHQCENRIGIFESLSTLFTDKFAHVEHDRCLHKGDAYCRYVASWDLPAHSKWKRAALLTGVIGTAVSVGAIIFWPLPVWLPLWFFSGTMTMGIYLKACVIANQELAETLQNQGNVAEDHIREIDYRYRGALLVQEIGQATSTVLDIRRLSQIVMENIEHYLDFDRGIIMLADEGRQRLLYSAGYGFDESMTEMLKKTQFHLDKPDSKGVFIKAFAEQCPILVDDIQAVSETFSSRSRQLIEQIGSKALICLPVVYEGHSLGILAVDNIISKRPLTKSDMNLLMGVAYQTAVSIFSANAFRSLQRSEGRYRSLYENAPTAYLSIDVGDAVIVNCNAAAVRLLGFERNDLIGSSLLRHVAGDKENQMRAQWMHQMLLDGQSVHNEAIEMLHRDDRSVWVNVSMEPFRDAKDRIVEGRCILVDTTEHRRLEEQLRIAQRMEAIGTLAGGVAHDLSNILAAIVSYPDLLLMDVPADSPLYEPLVKIKGAGIRAAAIVQDLLTLSRRGVAIIEVMNINAAIREYLESPEYDDLVARYAGLKITTDLASDLVPIKGSSLHLTKTLMNIMLNAAEALPHGGKIHIGTRNQWVAADDPRHPDCPGEYAVLSVEDNGHGIAPEDIKRVFEPFFTKKVMGRSGTGLGMAIVWAAVQDHNGFVDIDSRLDKGTTVRLYFPATMEKQGFRPAFRQESEYEGHGERILVVDDDAEHREIAVRMLTRLGYRATAVGSGEAAIALFEADVQPQLVVLDMMMGSGMDGLATYRRILALNPQQKAIITSGYAESGRVKKARDLGVGAYIKKPYSHKEIGAAVRYELDRPGPGAERL